MNVFIRSALILSSVVVVGQSAYAQPKASFEVFNPSSGLARTDELIVIKRTDVEKKIGADAAGSIFSIKDAKGNAQTLQFDDLNADGKWDEVVFLYSFAPAQKELFTISQATDAVALVKQRAHVRQQRKNTNDTFGPALTRDSISAGQPNTDFSKVKLPPFLTEGPAWENDKVGFRIYFDQRNTKDIWGKTTADMVLNTVGADPSKIYHHLDSWGMDILAVGKSLGAGSLALWMPQGGTRDTLIRLGNKNMGPVKYTKIADGPVRAIFKMNYPQWQALPDAAPLGLEETISIWGGQFFYQSDVVVTNAPRGAFLVSGIVNLFSKKVDKVNFMGCQGIATYDKQSENKDMLGLAILSPRDSYRGIGTTPNERSEVTNTYYVKMNIAGGHRAQYRFFAGWEKTAPAFATAEGFNTYMNEQAKAYAQVLRLRWR